MVNNTGEDKHYNDLRFVRKFDDRIFVALNYAFAVLSVLLLTMPIMQAYLLGTYYRMVMIITMGGWLFTTFLLEPRWIFRIEKVAVGMLALVIFYVSFAVINNGNIRPMIHVVAAPYYMFFVFYFYYFTGRKKFLSIVGISVFAAIVVTVVTTLNAMLSDPYITREIENLEQGIENFKKNIGNVHLIYSSAIIGTMIACYLQGGVFKKRIHKYFAILIMIVCFWTGFIGSSGITFISSIIAIAYILLQKNTAFVRYMTIACIIVTVLVCKDSVADFIIKQSGHIENHYISVKVHDVGESLKGGEATGTFAARSDRWMSDLKIGLDTYLIGCGACYQGGGSSKYHVTDHSQLFSDFARYGIVFTVYMAGLFFAFKNMMAKMYEEAGIKCNIGAVYLIFIIMYVCQPVMINFLIPMTFMFVLPSSVQIIRLLNGEFKGVSVLVPETIELEEKMDELSEENNGEQN